MNWIYLSKNGDDEYIDMYAHGLGCSSTPLETWSYEDSADPIMLRGIMKHKIIKQCWADGRPFRYMDSGYLGNRPGFRNPHGWKLWHRIVPNNLQHDQVIPRSSDRWHQLGLEISRRRHGSSILIVAPDEKPCKFYDIELETWLTETINTIKQHTDRPIVMRERNKSRTERKINRVENALGNVHALVTFNSVAAVESILAGVPAFVLAPTHIAEPVASKDLSQIENPVWANRDTLDAWCHSMAYGQYHVKELRDGTAFRMMQEQ
jgi:hypothetical protein